MKRIALCIAAGSLALLVFAPLASAFGWKDVVKMHRAGIADSLIIQKIEYSGKVFHLDADEIAKLAEEGVSDEVISAMLRTEAEEYDDDYDRHYDRDYYYPHRRAYVGWGYYYPRYYPYYSHGYYPYYGYYGGYRYPRSYELYRHRPTGDLGTTRERTRVENRINPRTQGGSGYRTRTQAPSPPRSHSSPPRSGGSTSRTRR